MLSATAQPVRCPCITAVTTALALSVLAAGCGREPDRSDLELLVRVEAEETGRPVPGVKVLLLDAQSNRPLSGPVASDASGVCRLTGAGAGQPRLVVFGGPDWSVHSQPDWYGTLRLAGGLPAAGGPLAPATSPALMNTVVMRPRGRPGTQPLFSGKVVDAQTERPLDQVFVTLSPWPTGYGAGTAASDDVTGPDGVFTVYDVPIAIDLETGIGFQVLPLLISREGYRTVRWWYDPPGGLDYTEIRGLVIPLTPLGPGDSGRLSGRVERDGAPVADLLLGLGLVTGDKGAVGVAGQVARTGADGRFLFEHLSGGTYVIYPGFLVGDGAWFAGDQPAVPVTPDATADAGVLAVLHEIVPVIGNPGRLAATDTIASFAWSAVPGAVRYGWFLDGELAAEGVSSEVTVALPALEPGLHLWQVTALDAGEGVVGVMQNPAWLRKEAP